MSYRKFHRGYTPGTFCNKMMHLLALDSRQTFEFYKDSLEGRFLAGFRSRYQGETHTEHAIQNRYFHWKYRKVELVSSNITIEISRDSLIELLNINIEERNQAMISQYAENAILLNRVYDPMKIRQFLEKGL